MYNISDAWGKSWESSLAFWLRMSSWFPPKWQKCALFVSAIWHHCQRNSRNFSVYLSCCQFLRDAWEQVSFNHRQTLQMESFSPNYWSLLRIINPLVTRYLSGKALETLNCNSLTKHNYRQNLQQLSCTIRTNKDQDQNNGSFNKSLKQIVTFLTHDVTTNQTLSWEYPPLLFICSNKRNRNSLEIGSSGWKGWSQSITV